MSESRSDNIRRIVEDVFRDRHYRANLCFKLGHPYDYELADKVKKEVLDLVADYESLVSEHDIHEEEWQDGHRWTLTQKEEK